MKHQLSSVRNRFLGVSAPFVISIDTDAINGFIVENSRIEKDARIDLPVDLQSISADALGQQLAQLKEYLGIRKSSVREAAIVLQADVFNLLILDAPQMQRETLAQYITVTLKENPALEIDKSFYPFQVIGQPRANRESVFVVTVAKRIIEKIVEAMNKAHIVPLFITPAPVLSLGYLRRTYPLAVDRGYLVVEVGDKGVFVMLLQNYALRTVVSRRLSGKNENEILEEIRRFIVFAESRGEKLEEIIFISEENLSGWAQNNFPGLKVSHIEDYYRFSASFIPIFGAAANVHRYPDIEEINLLPFPNAGVYSLLRITSILKFWSVVQVAIFAIIGGFLALSLAFFQNDYAFLAQTSFRGGGLPAADREEYDRLRTKVTEFNEFARTFQTISAQANTKGIEALQQVVSAAPAEVTLIRANIGEGAVVVTATVPSRLRDKVGEYKDKVSKISGLRVDLPVSKIQDSGGVIQFELTVQY